MATMGPMKMPFKRFSEEFYYYSSQLVIFFIVIIFLTSGSLSMGIASSLFVVILMLVQTFLLVSQGHMPLMRFLLSLITPFGYSILRAATSNLQLTETTNVLLWGAAIYIGFFQALSLSVRGGLAKRVAEVALSLGSAVIFFAFYYYLDLRLNLTGAYERGEIGMEAYRNALRMANFTSGLKQFASSPQHLFALLGIASFDLMLLASRMRSINLRMRLDKFLEQEPRSQAEEPALAQDVEAGISASPSPKPSRLLVTAISSDIVGFTALAETLGVARAVDFLNRYYALWTHVASAQGGRIISISGDSVIVIFGLADEHQSPERALAAAYAFMDEMEGMRQDLVALSFPGDLTISIGLHSGIVVSATLGPPGDQKRNVYGDTIAVAARLDSMCRELHQDLVVSHSTYRRLSLESQASLERIGEILLKQSTRPMPVYTRK